MFEHSTDDEFHHVYKNILLQSKTSTARTDFCQGNCYIIHVKLNETFWAWPGMLDHMPDPTKTV